VSRRWKASVISGVVLGLSIHSIYYILRLAGWLIQVNLATIPSSLIIYFSQLIPGILGIDSIIIMPIIIMATFIAYVRFEQSGDRLIEKYWRNPKINYPEGQKPPFLKL